MKLKDLKVGDQMICNKCRYLQLEDFRCLVKIVRMCESNMSEILTLVIMKRVFISKWVSSCDVHVSDDSIDRYLIEPIAEELLKL